MWTREMLKSNAKQMFYRNYWECVAVSVLIALLSAASGINANVSLENDALEAAVTVLVISAAGLALTLLKIFVGNVIEVGGCNFFIKNRNQKAGVGAILSGFKSGHYGNIVLTIFLRDLFVSLWTLLFIVPGIIKGYEYMMVPYILAENPGMDRKEAFAISRRMMEGQKWDAFVLDLSFTGWILLTVFTCGILGIFFVDPYIQTTHAELYAFNKIKAYNAGYIR